MREMRSKYILLKKIRKMILDPLHTWRSVMHVSYKLEAMV
jgi:hypothetical protein